MNMNVTPPLPPAPVEQKRRTITLTNRAPIEIIESEWSVIAQGEYNWEHPGGPEIAGFSFSIRVRRGPFHRIIIHATYHNQRDDNEDECQTVRVGRVLQSDPLNHIVWENVLGVGEELRCRIRSKTMQQYVVHMLDACFANMKPLTY